MKDCPSGELKQEVSKLVNCHRLYKLTGGLCTANVNT